MIRLIANTVCINSIDCIHTVCINSLDCTHSVCISSLDCIHSVCINSLDCTQCVQIFSWLHTVCANFLLIVHSQGILECAHCQANKVQSSTSFLKTRICFLLNILSYFLSELKQSRIENIRLLPFPCLILPQCIQRITVVNCPHDISRILCYAATAIFYTNSPDSRQ